MPRSQPTRSARLAVAALVVVALALPACRTGPGPTAPGRPWPLPPRGESAPEPRPVPTGCPQIERLEVHKSERALVVFCQGGAEHRLTVALGREPVGHKLRQGDRRTPEGDYRVSGPVRESRFHRFIPIDYPSAADVERARATGRLDEAGYRAAVETLREGGPVLSPLGSAIGLHGEGDRWRGWSRYVDWTFGCIALADAELDFIGDRVEVGTPIRILP